MIHISEFQNSPRWQCKNKPKHSHITENIACHLREDGEVKNEKFRELKENKREQ